MLYIPLVMGYMASQACVAQMMAIPLTAMGFMFPGSLPVVSKKPQ